MRLIAVIAVSGVLGACASSGRSSSNQVVSEGRCTIPSADSTVYDTTQVTVKPLILSGPAIMYPDELRRQHISGQVLLSAIVSARGLPEPLFQAPCVR